MEDLLPPFYETLRRVVGTAIQDRSGRHPGFGTAEIAKELGIGRRNFQHYMERGAGMRHCPAQLVPALCRVLRNDELLDVLERAAGRVAFRPPARDAVDRSDVQAASGLVREVGRVLQRLAETLDDGVVEATELSTVLPALDDVIRECVTLKAWLDIKHSRRLAGEASRKGR